MVRSKRTMNMSFQDLKRKKRETQKTYSESANYDDWIEALHRKLAKVHMHIDWDDKEAYSVELDGEELSFLMHLMSEWGDKRVAEHYDEEFVKNMRLKKDDRDRSNP